MQVKFSKYSKIKIKKNQFIISWLISYLVVLIIPVISNIYIYQKAENTIRDEANQSSSLMLEKLQMSVDSIQSDINTLVRITSTNSYLKQLLKVTNDTPLTDYSYTLISLANDLRNNTLFNKNISNIYIHFNNIDMAVSPYYLEKSHNFFDYFYSGDTVDYQSWYSTIHNQNYANYILVNHADGSKSIDFIYQIPPYETSFVDASLVIRVDEQTLLQNAQSYDNLDQKSIFIIDKSNQIIMSKGSTVAAPPVYETLPDIFGIASDKDYVITHQTSTANNWKYISVIPKSVFWAKLEFVRTLNYINLFICLIVGGLLGYYFTLKNYKPISKLAQMCKKLIKGNSVTDEYSLIVETLQHYENQNKELKDIKIKQGAFEKTLFFEKLLRGDIEISKPSAPDDYNINFISDYFGVVIFKINNLEMLFSDSQINANEKFELMLLIMSNIIEEMVGKQHKGYVSEIDGQIVCIINFYESSLSTWSEDLQVIIENAKEFIESNFEFSFFACMSNVHNGITGISEGYREAVQALRYKTFVSSSDVVFYDTINNDDSYADSLTLFSLEKENQLINFINMGDYQTSKEIVEHVLENYLKTSNIDMIRIFIFDLLSAILKSISADAA